MSWEVKNIAEITEVVTKGTTPSTYGYDFIDNGVNYIRAEGISKDGYVDESTFLKVSDECHSKLFRSQLKENDILFSIAGMALGKTGIVKEEYLPANTNQAVGIIRPIKEIVFPKFLQYYFINPFFYKMVNSVSAQSAQPNINLAQIKSLKINLPSLETQKRIASILSTYDDLIENNLKRIKLLEETAQNIYKEWFVNFRFPNYEHTEFDAESGLPKGWEKINLYDFVEIKMGFPFKAEDFNEVNIGKPAIRIRDIPLSWTKTHTTQEVSDEYIVEQGDILIGMDGFFYLDIWRGQKGYLVQRVCRIRAREQNLQGFLLESLRQPISYYEKTISGATVAHLGAKHLKEIFINVPKDNELLEELKVFNRLNYQKINLSNQNQKLKEARDILLPRLMNRMIEV